MEIKALVRNPVEISPGAVVVGFFEGETQLAGSAAALDTALGGAIAGLVAAGEIKGKLNEVTVVHTLGKLAAARVVVLGLGKPEALDPAKLGGAIAEMARALRRKGVTSIAVAPLDLAAAGIGPEAAAEAITEGALLGLYTFRQHQTKEAEFGEIDELTIIAADSEETAALAAGVARGRIIAEAAGLARDMVNEPANYMTPTIMAARAQELAETAGLEYRVLEQSDMEAMGMGGLLGVARGSREVPKLMVLRYRGRKAEKADLALVGKGITFDSGGISIKPADRMGEMKGDMSGGAAVIATMGAIARLAPRLDVLALVPATENLPYGSALKPGDVLKMMSGKTVEIISTDAEGRLILADALEYARQLGTQRIVDIATLTGACYVALGDVCSGAFGNNEELMELVLSAGKATGELIWQLPMYEEYREQNKSDIADIKNCGSRYGGAITAAQFLAEFIGDVPWVHLDIAGTFISEKERGCLVKGATGITVRALVKLVLALAANIS